MNGHLEAAVTATQAALDTEPSAANRSRIKRALQLLTAALAATEGKQ